MSRLAPAVLFLLICVLPGIAQAQTCPPPVILQVGGTNPACAGQPVTLDAGAGWTTYQWSPGGATTRMISDSPNQTMAYTVTTTDANGCSVTSQPLTVVVNAAPAAPAIQLRETTLCGGAQGEATVSGAWTSYAWSVTHGTIANGPSGPAANGATVDYTAGGTGPITVSVTVTDSNGCAVTANADVTLRTVGKPVALPYPLAICPDSRGEALALSPGDGGSWASFHWTVTNGTILPNSGGDSGPYVNFTSDPGGQPVTIQVTATDTHGCTATSDPVTIPVRSLAKPVVQTFADAICPGSPGYASVNPPAEGDPWLGYHWTVINGTIMPGSGDSGTNVSFYTSPGSQPVTVQVTATDGNGCTATSDPVTIPVRTIAKPVIQTFVNAICPGSPGYASVNPPADGGSWSSYHWTVTNGTIAQWSSDSGSNVTFYTSPGGEPVTVQVTATDFLGCSATSDPVTIPVRTIAKPVVQTFVAAICPGSPGYASINPPADGGSWSSYHWTVTNGTITQWSSDSGSNVTFYTSPGGEPVTVQVTATDFLGCSATSDPVTIPVRTIAKPVVQTFVEAICPGSPGYASINPPADGGSWSSYHWTVTNGTITQWSSDSGSNVTFYTSPGGEPVTVQVTATDGLGCSATSDPVTIPVRTIAKPVVQTFAAAICPGSPGYASINPPAEGGSWSSYHWTVVNGTITQWSGDSGSNVSFYTSPGGQPVTVQVTATDGLGCSATSDPVTIPVRVLDPPPITLASPSVCTGAYIDARIDSPAYPNSPWQSVTWNATNAVTSGAVMFPNDTAFFGTATGGPVTLTVTVSDMNGCSATSTLEIPVAANPPTAVMTIPENVCAGSVFTVTAHDPDNVVQWFEFNGTNATFRSNDGGGTATFTANGPGPVDIYATSGSPNAACAVYGHASTVAVNPPAATISASGPTAFCPGGSVTLTAPNGMLSYNWSTGATTQAITVTDAGSYTVTISNAPDCSSTSAPAVVTVAAPATPTITASGSTTICAGGSVTLTASAGAGYLWSTGATTQAITVNTGGSYTVTVTDAGGCSAASAPTVVTVDTPTASISEDGPVNFCEGGSVTLTASAGASYVWNTGPTTRSIVVTQDGYYRVTVTDANGCSASYGIIVSPRPAPQALVYVSNGSTSSCAGGQIWLQAAQAASYLWSTGATTQSIYATQSGNYSVTVTGVNGCTATSQPVAIHIDAAPILPLLSASPAQVCPSATTATVTVTNFASFSSIYYMTNATVVSSTNGVLQISRAPNSGAFYVDAYGSTLLGNCQYIGHIDVPQGTGPDATITSPSTVCAGSPVTASVPDAGPGSAYHWEVGLGTAVTGTDTRTVMWTPYSFNNNPAQLYCVVTDANGCSTQALKYVTVTPQPAAQISITPLPFCDDGLYTATTLSAGAGSTYNWRVSNGTVVTNDGTTSVTFRDAPESDGLPVYVDLFVFANGCSNTAHAVLHPLPSPSIAITAGGPTTFCAGGSVTLTATAGLSSYLWSNGATTRSITVSSSGNYSVTGTGANGCSKTSTTTVVTANANPTATITAGGPTTFCAGGSVTLTASSGASYLWSNGSTTQSITASAAGSYSVTVTTGAGCSATSAPTTVVVNAVPSVFISVHAQVYGALGTATDGPPPYEVAALTAPNTYTYCGLSKATLVAVGGDPSSSYLWSTGATSSQIDVTQSGTYSVTITSANICAAGDSVTVNLNPIPTATITANGPLAICPNGGSVILTANAADSYAWSTGETTQSITVTQPGPYHVVVTTGGCSATSSDTVVTMRDVGTITGGTAFCAGGSATLTAPLAATYAWSNGATTRAITVSTAGNYSVTIGDGAGCSMTTPPVTVSQSTPAASFSATATTICNGQTATFTANATGGSGYTYQWMNGSGPIAGAVAASYDATVSDVYYVVVTDAGGCSVSTMNSAVFLQVKPSPLSYIVVPDNFCSGSTYSVATPDGSFASYTWSVTNGTLQSTNRNVAVIVAGTSGSVTVQLTVTNSYGCSWTGSQIVPIVSPPPVPVITASGPTSFCQGGQVTLTAPAGYSYTWRLGSYVYDTNQSITVGDASFSGSFTVTVTNAGGCSTTSAPTVVSVNANPDTPVITAGGPTTLCAGGNVTLTAPASSSYQWSTGATAQSITVNSGGSYSVTVTNASGCSATSNPTVVTANVLPTASITAGGPTTFCAGGSVTLTASSGASYLWSTGATTQSIAPSASGSYSVTVTNASGCSAISSPTVVTANVLPAATITAGGPTTFCTGGSVTMTASSGSSYLWSTGATTQSIIASTSGSYSVTVTSNGCSAVSAPVVVTVNANPPAPVITAGGPTTFCAGGSVTLTAPASPAYLWSNGATTQSIIASTSGNYTVAITDPNGCRATSAPTSVTVNALPSPSIAVNGPLTYCQSFSSTTLSASPSTGTWYRNGVSVSTNANIDIRNFGTGTGSFVWRATNAAGCTKDSDPVVVTVNPAPNNSSSFGFLCWNGTSDAQSSESAPGTTYQWSVTNGTITSGAGTIKITYAAAANATTVGIDLTVTSAAGCPTMPATLHYDVPVQVLPTSISAAGPTTFCVGNSVVLTAATVSGAAAYIWSNGFSGQAMTVTTSGSFSVHVVNASNGCVGQESAPVSVTVQPAPVATITAGGPTTFCTGGSVTLTASSGTSYLWSTGATTSSIAVNSSGSYTVTVTNANGCSATSSPTAVTVNAIPTATITTGGPTTFCAGGSVTLTASSGATYLWSTGATTQAIAASTTGNYSVTVTNASGCGATSSPTTVTVNANPTASITAGGPTTFCAGGSVTLTASSGTSYLWSTGATTSSITVSSSGNYSVTVTNANGCSATSSPTTVTANANPTATIAAGGPTTFCAGGSVTLTASSGSSYLWSNGATTQAINATAAGSYSVTVTNASGCSATSSPTAVIVNTLPTATITAGGPTTFCAGGSVTLTSSSGASYLWSNGATTQAINATAAGNYSVTVTNASGCSATSSSTTVTVNANPTATITAGGPTTFCTGGSVTLTASSGASYLWSTGATTSSIVASSSGSYTVRVTNAAGCNTISAPTVVTVNANPTATITAGGPTTFCTGGSVTLTASSGTSYLWSTGATTSSIAVSSSGSYTVRVTNAAGCNTTSAPTVVTVNANPTATITAGGPTTFCAGGSVTLTASSGSSYLWSTGATTQAISATTSGSYSVTVTNANACPGTSAPTVVTVNAAASITTQPVNKTTTRNTSVTLTVVAAGTSPISYQWFKGNGTSISGATSSSYTTSFPSKGTNTFYVQVWNACNTTHVKSTTVTVTVN